MGTWTSIASWWAHSARRRMSSVAPPATRPWSRHWVASPWRCAGWIHLPAIVPEGFVFLWLPLCDEERIIISVNLCVVCYAGTHQDYVSCGVAACCVWPPAPHWPLFLSLPCGGRSRGGPPRSLRGWPGVGERELAEDTGLAKSAYMSSESALRTELLLDDADDTDDTLLTLRDLQ